MPVAGGPLDFNRGCSLRKLERRVPISAIPVSCIVPIRGVAVGYVTDAVAFKGGGSPGAELFNVHGALKLGDVAIHGYAEPQIRIVAAGSESVAASIGCVGAGVASRFELRFGGG